MVGVDGPPPAPVVATGDEGGVVAVANIATGKVLAAVRAHAEPVECVLFHPNAALPYFATGALDGSLKIWDAGTLAERAACVGHTLSIVRLSWHTSEPILFSASADASVRMWDARSGACLRVWYGHADAILDMAVLGSVILTGGDDDVALVFSNAAARTGGGADE